MRSLMPNSLTVISGVDVRIDNRHDDRVHVLGHRGHQRESRVVGVVLHLPSLPLARKKVQHQHKHQPSVSVAPPTSLQRPARDHDHVHDRPMVVVHIHQEHQNHQDDHQTRMNVQISLAREDYHAQSVQQT